MQNNKRNERKEMYEKLKTTLAMPTWDMNNIFEILGKLSDKELNNIFNKVHSKNGNTEDLNHLISHINTKISELNSKGGKRSRRSRRSRRTRRR